MAYRGHAPSDPGASPMFEPFTLRALTLKNRLALAAMSQYSAHDGIPDEVCRK